jgi:hypothetical protein
LLSFFLAPPKFGAGKTHNPSYPRVLAPPKFGAGKTCHLQNNRFSFWIASKKRNGCFEFPKRKRRF